MRCHDLIIRFVLQVRGMVVPSCHRNDPRLHSAALLVRHNTISVRCFWIHSEWELPTSFGYTFNFCAQGGAIPMPCKKTKVQFEEHMVVPSLSDETLSLFVFLAQDPCLLECQHRDRYWINASKKRCNSTHWWSDNKSCFIPSWLSCSGALMVKVQTMMSTVGSQRCVRNKTCTPCLPLRRLEHRKLRITKGTIPNNVYGVAILACSLIRLNVW
jgi:hypothetical protein